MGSCVLGNFYKILFNYRYLQNFHVSVSGLNNANPDSLNGSDDSAKAEPTLLKTASDT